MRVNKGNKKHHICHNSFAGIVKKRIPEQKYRLWGQYGVGMQTELIPVKIQPECQSKFTRTPLLSELITN